MKKIAFLVAGVNAGGTENYLLRFLKYYKDEIAATVYCKSGQLGELENEFNGAGIKLKPFYLGYFSIRRYRALYKEFIEEKYDSVCDLTGSFGAFPLLMAKSASIPIRIAFFRNAGEKFKKSIAKTLYHSYIKILLPKVATKVLSNSKTALNYFYKGKEWWLDPKFEVIYNGVDSNDFIKGNSSLRKELGLNPSTFVVGHVGRYNEQKNHQTIIKVAIDLCKGDKDIVFILCGKNVQQAFQQEIEALGLSNQIFFLGVRRDVDAVLRTMDCFYFPSTIEGQPNALIEALFVGLPFVCSDIEPIKETIPSNFHNQLIAPFDSDAAKEKIMEIKECKELSESLNLSNWAKEYYNPRKWFQLFYDKL